MHVNLVYQGPHRSYQAAHNVEQAEEGPTALDEIGEGSLVPRAPEGKTYLEDLTLALRARHRLVEIAGVSVPNTQPLRCRKEHCMFPNLLDNRKPVERLSSVPAFQQSHGEGDGEQRRRAFSFPEARARALPELGHVLQRFVEFRVGDEVFGRRSPRRPSRFDGGKEPPKGPTQTTPTACWPVNAGSALLHEYAWVQTTGIHRRAALAHPDLVDDEALYETESPLLQQSCNTALLGLVDPLVHLDADDVYNVAPEIEALQNLKLAALKVKRQILDVRPTAEMLVQNVVQGAALLDGTADRI
mmetsp:Transcript_113166/g.320296  ORF Transcript_113166/g.320296 Transcript_113166/m.320296 type:complete len:301 (+) Transcript_113166:714-1616(+)